MNYSIICPEFNTYPLIYLIFVHGSSLISIPFNLLTIYVIISKSSQAMKEYKWYLLNYQLWCTGFELGMNTGMAPVIYFPIMMAWPHGIFYRLGMPMLWQVILVICLLFGSFAAAIHLFCYRHAIILPEGYPTRQSDTFYIFFRGSLYLLYVVIIPPIIYYLTPDQISIKLEIFKEYSCSPADLMDPRVYAFVSSSSTRIYFILTFSGVIILAGVALFICAFCVFDSFWFLNNRSNMMSEKTRQLQYYFLSTLVTQISIPFVFYFAPVTLMVFGYLIDYFNQSLYNFLMFLVIIHGTVSSLIMLAVNAPYRYFIARNLLLGEITSNPFQNEQYRQSVFNLEPFKGRYLNRLILSLR